MIRMLAAALLCVAAPALAQAPAQPKQLTVQPSIARELAQMIRSSGGDCPEVRTVYHVGSDDRGNIMRIVCGQVGGPAIESPTFRMHSTFAGNAKISRWEP
jgi:hypothetical protein